MATTHTLTVTDSAGNVQDSIELEYPEAHVNASEPDDLLHLLWNALNDAGYSQCEHCGKWSTRVEYTEDGMLHPECAAAMHAKAVQS